MCLCLIFAAPLLFFQKCEIDFSAPLLSLQGIVHHDIKSLNVLVDEELSIAKLSDFGEAKLKGLNTTRFKLGATHRGIGGTILYQAPEILSGEVVEPSRVSEMYSFGGKLVWECLMREVPQLGTPDLPPSPPDSMEQPSPESSAWEALHAVSASCLSHDRKSRPTSSQVLRALNAGLSPGDSHEDILSMLQSPAPGGKQHSPFKKYWKLAALSAGVLAIIIAAVVGTVPPSFPLPPLLPTPSPTQIADPQPSPAPSVPGPLSFLSLLPAHTTQSIRSNSNSPQAKALRWLESSPEFNLSDPVDLLQPFALATFYYSTGGGDWSNKDGWLDQSVSPCSWYSTSRSPCNNLTQLTQLFLDDNNLYGPIPPEIGLLTDLIAVSLDFNDLTGPIPTTIGQISKLRGLFLESTGLLESIPETFGQLSQLQSLNLGGNFLTGAVPTSFGQLSQLSVLSLDDNLLIGSLQGISIGSLTKLEYLDLSGNQIQGPIPTGLGLIPNLQILFLQTNNFSGAIPSELGRLTSTDSPSDLWSHDDYPVGAFNFLENSGLTGSVPSEVCALKQIRGSELSIIVDCSIQCTCCDERASYCSNSTRRL